MKMMKKGSYFVSVAGDTENRFRLLSCITGKEGVKFVQSSYRFGGVLDSYLVEAQALSRFQSWVMQCHCSITSYMPR